MNAKPEPRARTKARLKRLAQKNRATVMQAVDARDNDQCRICQITTSAYDLIRQPHHHHIKYRSQGGQDTVENVILLCASCHDKVHRSGKLRLLGQSDDLQIERLVDDTWKNVDR